MNQIILNFFKKFLSDKEILTYKYIFSSYFIHHSICFSGTEEPIVRHVESKDERDKRRKGRELKIEEMRKKYGVAKA